MFVDDPGPADQKNANEFRRLFHKCQFMIEQDARTTHHSHPNELVATISSAERRSRCKELIRELVDGDGSDDDEAGGLEEELQWAHCIEDDFHVSLAEACFYSCFLRSPQTTKAGHHPKQYLGAWPVKLVTDVGVSYMRGAMLEKNSKRIRALSFPDNYFLTETRETMYVKDLFLDRRVNCLERLRPSILICCLARL